MKKSSYVLSTIRKKAEKINYHVEKGFQHCRDAVIYDRNGNRQSGYMVMDYSVNAYVHGCYNEFYDYLWDLNDVVEFLQKQYELLGLDW